MAMQARAIAGLALRDADDQATRPPDRSAGTASLIIRRRQDRIDPPRCDLLHRAGWNAVRLEILCLVGLQLVEPGDAGFHFLGSERFRCHGGSSICMQPWTITFFAGTVSDRFTFGCCRQNVSTVIRADIAILIPLTAPRS